jgi:hypothetical protein
MVTTDVANGSSLHYSGPTPRSALSRCDVDVTGAANGWVLTRVGRTLVGLTGVSLEEQVVGLVLSTLVVGMCDT